MRYNQNTVIVDPLVVLVPYRHEHVAKYHEWMQSTELQELTASEPLSLEQEYDMQRKWREDEDKLTFIILANESAEDATDNVDSDWLKTLPMVGDVNLFLKGDLCDEDFEAEVEIMVAEAAYRRRGLAHTVLQLFLSYATSTASSPSPPTAAAGANTNPASIPPIPRTRLVARIGMQNAPSIALFGKLGFVETKRVEVFGELEMRWRATASPDEWKRGEVREVRFPAD
ncbi:acyl-CoA N-acyltransferase [Fomitopsis betulina]|nr:acyl-CoA N-acyltransferase [Fomitopsis betulina]